MMAKWKIAVNRCSYRLHRSLQVKRYSRWILVLWLVILLRTFSFLQFVFCNICAKIVKWELIFLRSLLTEWTWYFQYSRKCEIIQKVIYDRSKNWETGRKCGFFCSLVFCPFSFYSMHLQILQPSYAYRIWSRLYDTSFRHLPQHALIDMFLGNVLLLTFFLFFSFLHFSSLSHICTRTHSIFSHTLSLFLYIYNALVLGIYYTYICMYMSCIYTIEFTRLSRIISLMYPLLFPWSCKYKRTVDTVEL